MTQNTAVEPDPFDKVGVPSVSFKDAKVGDSRVVKVTRGAEMVQTQDFETGEPAYWPADKTGAQQPKMAAVITGTDEEGNEVSVWARKTSALFTAIGSAQRKAREKHNDPELRIGAGGTLTITLSGLEPNSNKKLNDKKLYTVEYVPGNPFED